MKSGKLAIATSIGCDVADLERYQNERGLYYCGDTYYFSRPTGSRKKLPDGYEWKKISSDWFDAHYRVEVFACEAQ